MTSRVFLISTIRSYSVCVTRVLDQTKRFRIFHEPFVSVYDEVHFPNVAGWFKETAFSSVDQVRDNIDRDNVLIKDMAFAIHDYVSDIAGVDDRYILMFRNPKDVFVSFLKKRFTDDASTMLDLSGYNKLLSIHQYLRDKGCKNILVVCSDDLRECLNKIFSFLSMEFKLEYLTWDNTDEETISSRWTENKKDDQFFFWHGEALHSDHVEFKLGPYHSIDEIKHEPDRKLCDELINAAQKPYKKLLELTSCEY